MTLLCSAELNSWLSLYLCRVQGNIETSFSKNWSAAQWCSCFLW